MIFANADLEQPVALESSELAAILSTLYIFIALIICGDFVDLNDGTAFLV
jgi:hypothetical protein